MPPDLSVVVVFYDMAREAPRTLHTLRTDYQRDAGNLHVEVLAIDNGSPEPLRADALEAALPGVIVHRFETESASPVAALNWGIEQVSSDRIMCIIDGARMLSPGIFSQALDVIDRYGDALVATPALYLGSQLQTDAITNGYDTAVEDELLSSVDWQNDGYSLFAVSNRAAHLRTVFGPQTESNCFVLRTDTLRAAGGFDERFQSVGGGLANLELFERLLARPGLRPVSLLGEATFHQVHGGITTNKSRRDRPMELHHDEYEAIVGHRYEPPQYEPFYVGYLDAQLREDLFDRNVPALIAGVRRVRRFGDLETALGIAVFLDAQQPNDPRILEVLAESQTAQGDPAEAIATLRRAIDIAPGRARLHVALGRLLDRAGDSPAAQQSYRNALDANPQSGGALFELGNLAKRDGSFEAARDWYVASSASEPRDSRFRLALARVEGLLSNSGAAIEHALAAVELAPLNGRTRLTAAQILASAGDRATANRELDVLRNQIRSGREFDPAVYVDLAEAFRANGDHAGATEIASAALVRSPRDPSVRRLAKRMAL